MRHARFRAHRKGQAFDLENHLEDLQKRIDAGFCEVSGLPFNLDGGRTWDSPSFDRVDSTRGYTHDNVRVVLHAVNSALGDWGEAKMLEIARAIMARRTAASNALSERLGQNLMTLLEGRGAPEYELTWNRSVTPSGHVMYRLRASGRRTSASGSTGWPTPQAHDATGRSKTQKEKHGTKHGCACLARSADLAGWPTPMTGSPGTEEYNPAGNTDSSRKTVALAGWTTPQAHDAKNMTAVNFSRELSNDARLAGWPTPQASDAVEGARTALDSRQKCLGRDMKLVFGPTPSSSPAGTGKPAALSPRFSLWLMGYPAAWASCGELAMQSCRKSRRPSSKPSTPA